MGAVRPSLEYGASAWATAAKPHTNKLDKVQNIGLKTILGAMKISPVAEMVKTAVLNHLRAGDRPNFSSMQKDRGACSTKMPPLRSHKRRRVACQHFPDDQTLRLQAGAGEDDVIHLPSGLDRVDCERQEEEEDPCRNK